MQKVLWNASLILTLWGCGSERQIEPKTPVPQPTTKPGPGGEITFAEVQAVTDASCKRCHSTSQFLKSEAAWRASEAKARVSAGSMPPPSTPEARNISADDKATLINF